MKRVSTPIIFRNFNTSFLDEVNSSLSEVNPIILNIKSIKNHIFKVFFNAFSITLTGASYPVQILKLSAP